MTIRVWDASTGEDVMNPISGAFSPDGTCIVTGSRDGTIRVWDEGHGQILVKGGGKRSAHFDTRSLSFSTLTGWITGPSGRLILWIFPDYHSGLVSHPCCFVIGPFQIFVDWQLFVHGTDWTFVHTPQIFAS
jgi:WD40 repeat protein